MTVLSDEVRQVIDGMTVFPVATASREGVPNVVPMTFVKVVDDDTLLPADNFMHKSRANIEENTVVGMSVWDMQTKRAYQLKATAEIVESGDVFDEAVEWVHKAMPEVKTKAAVVLKVRNVFVCHPGPDHGRDIAEPQS